MTLESIGKLRGAISAHAWRDSRELEPFDEACGEIEREVAELIGGLQAEVDGLTAENAALREWKARYGRAMAEAGHWKRVAGKHASEMQELRKALKLERERAASGLPEGVEWPRYADGGFVEFGKYHTVTIEGIEFTPDSVIVNTNRETRKLDYGARVKRPPLLAADGQPIEVGQVLYGEDGRGWTVQEVRHGEKYAVTGSCGGEVKPLKARWLTHEPPDSWERIAEDIRAINGDTYAHSGTADLGAIAERVEKLAGAL